MPQERPEVQKWRCILFDTLSYSSLVPIPFGFCRHGFEVLEF